MALDRFKHPAWLLAFFAAIAVAAVIMGHVMLTVDTSPLSDISRRYEIPPTFGTNRLLYASVVALMLTASLLALGAFIENVRFLASHPGAFNEPAKVVVLNETILLLAIILSIVPDVIVLVSWGEIMAPPYALVSKWDRAMDGLAAIAFSLFIFRRLRARPSILFQLQRDAIPIGTEPNWQQLRPKMLIVSAVTIISFGVAFAK